MQFSINKQTIIVGAILLASILAIIGIFALVDNKNISDQEETGGAGKPESQQLVISGWDTKDEFGNTVGSQLELEEQDFIRSQILFDHNIEGKDKDLLVYAKTVPPIKRIIANSKNTMSFQIELGSTKYRIFMDYSNRKVTIENLETNRQISQISISS